LYRAGITRNDEIDRGGRYAAAEARSISVDGATCRVTGAFALNLRRVSAIRIEVVCDSCPPADLAHLVDVAERGCLVAATLRQGMSVTASVTAVA
jgi:putative redox protein